MLILRDSVHQLILNRENRQGLFQESASKGATSIIQVLKLHPLQKERELLAKYLRVSSMCILGRILTQDATEYTMQRHQCDNTWRILSTMQWESPIG